MAAVGCVSSGNPVAQSDHFDGKKFFNPGHTHTKGFLSLLKWQLTNDKKKWPEKVENKTYPLPTGPLERGEIQITFVNHSTLLVRTESFNFLTDPVWSERVSPFTWVGPKRVRSAGLSIDQLPPIHAVLVSHNHYDHLDVGTLKILDKKFRPQFFVPLGDGKLLRENGIDNVVEMDWWQTHELQDAKITFMPSMHWSGRWLNDRFDCLWGAFGVEIQGKRVYFAGDTGFADHFKTTRQKWGAPDISFLPIGAYEPRWFMKDYHMNPAEAVQAFQDLESKRAIGIHQGTFQLTDEGIDEPTLHLQDARQAQGIPPEAFRVLDQGETWILKKADF